MKFITSIFAAVSALFLTACSVSPPKDLSVINNFDVKRYQGDWYEIARLENSFERGLTKATANYAIQEDGTVRVTNRGYDPRTKEWKESVGVAKFVSEPNVGALKVSFFGPFYGGYNIIALDKGYNYALVAGNDRSYLWLLSRKPSIDAKTKREYLDIAKANGFAVDQLVWNDWSK
ncbi:lipocalin family protein [Microvirga sp. W0021]|uniref:Outer membrane lipoprotein Blc n=1 Tax=Hohaiivirga grylli TaxID=3133970 RepID=A0ABV0BJ85_9HYPH